MGAFNIILLNYETSHVTAEFLNNLNSNRHLIPVAKNTSTTLVKIYFALVLLERIRIWSDVEHVSGKVKEVGKYETELTFNRTV